MYNIIDQSKQINMSLLLNGTNSNSTTASGAKFDCAKECPCGVPAIVSRFIQHLKLMAVKNKRALFLAPLS